MSLTLANCHIPKTSSVLATYYYDEENNPIIKEFSNGNVDFYSEDITVSNDFLFKPVTMEQIGHTVGYFKDNDFNQVDMDHLGSILKTKNNSINVSTPYGERSGRSAEDFDIIDFTLKGYDKDIDAVRMGRRYYDPEAKRFLTPDGYFVENPEETLTNQISANLYSYAGNNPIMKTDPTGNLDIWGLFQFDAGEEYGESAAQHWADTAYKAEQSGESLKAAGANFMGGLASLWTKETSTDTFNTLSLAYGVSKYAAQFTKPKELYHFTSKEGAKNISKTGIIKGSEKGVTGSGVYATRYKSKLAAKLQGAKSTQVRIKIKNVENFKAQPNPIPGIFKSTKNIKVK